MPQTSIAVDRAVAYPGMLADGGFHDIVSRAVETAAGVAAGRIMVEGTLPLQQAIVPTSAVNGVLPVGCTKYEPIKEPRSPAGPEFAQYDMVNLVRRGRIWMLAGTGGVTRYAQHYLIHAGAEAGLLTLTDDANTVAISGVTVLLTAAAGVLTLVEFNLSTP